MFCSIKAALSWGISPATSRKRVVSSATRGLTDNLGPSQRNRSSEMGMSKRLSFWATVLNPALKQSMIPAGTGLVCASSIGGLTATVAD